jgi:lactoylglutathione lyase
MSDRFSLHHVSLFVRNVDASAAFHANVLGLQEIPNRVGKSHIRWFTVDAFRTFHLIGGDLEPERPVRSPRMWRSPQKTSRRRSLAWSSMA